MKKYILYIVIFLLQINSTNISNATANTEGDNGQQENDLDPEDQIELDNPWDPRED
jgi:hypothetical protein